MKKNLLILLFFIAVSLPVSAAISVDDVMSDDYIRNHGHSEEMVRLMDLQNSQINGEPAKYKVDEPEYYTTDKRVKFIRQAMKYLDCGLDSGEFGNSKIKYTTRYDDL